MKDISLVKLLPMEPKVPFINLRVFAAGLSFLLIIASVVLFATKNLNYGIDFTGGTVLEIDTGGEPELEIIRSSVNDLDLGVAGLQLIAPQNGNGVDYNYARVTIPIQPETAKYEFELSVRVVDYLANLNGDTFKILTQGEMDKGGRFYNIDLGRAPTSVDTLDDIPAEGGEKAAMSGLGFTPDMVETINLSGLDYDALRVEIPLRDKPSPTVQQIALGLVKLTLRENVGDYTERTQNVVGSKVSGELRTKGILAILSALAMIMLYIWFRFEWQFAVGAVSALFHDVLLTIGVFSLTGIEFNLSIIAAILTIVGYSLNDTVIVYDRIRENLRKYKKMPMADVLNLSINDTLSRTILTSMTTLLALIALYILGGDGLRGFSFAMIWGVIVGTYSSIFVASPLLMLLKLKRGGNTGGVRQEV